VGIDGEQVVGADQQAVAVGGRMRDQIADDIAAGSRLVLHHDRLAETLRQRLRHQAGDDIGRPAGRKRQIQMHGAGRVSLRPGRRRRKDGKYNRGKADQSAHLMSPRSAHMAAHAAGVRPGRQEQDAARGFRIVPQFTSGHQRLFRPLGSAPNGLSLVDRASHNAA